MLYRCHDYKFQRRIHVCAEEEITVMLFRNLLKIRTHVVILALYRNERTVFPSPEAAAAVAFMRITQL